MYHFGIKANISNVLNIIIIPNDIRLVVYRLAALATPSITEVIRKATASIASIANISIHMLLISIIISPFYLCIILFPESRPTMFT